MQEENTRLFVHHVIMHCHDFNTVFYECFDNRLHFVFKHCEIAADGSPRGCSLPCGPGVESHEAAHRYTMFAQLNIRPSDRVLVYSLTGFPFMTDKAIKHRNIKRVHNAVSLS